MKSFSKRNVLKIPSEISVFYSEKQRLLLIKSSSQFKLVKLKVKLILIQNQNVIIVTREPLPNTLNKSQNKFKSLQGTTSAIIKQTFLDVLADTCKKLKLVGVGYKVFNANVGTFCFLDFKLGYSHNFLYKVPENITIKLKDSTKLFIFGSDFLKVSHVGATLRSLKLPEPYKGKGILYSNEIIQLKEGKKV